MIFLALKKDWHPLNRYFNGCQRFKRQRFFRCWMSITLQNWPESLQRNCGLFHAQIRDEADFSFWHIRRFGYGRKQEVELAYMLDKR